MSALDSNEELQHKIYEITQTMFATLSQWQAGVTINWESAKIKGRRELLELILADRQTAVRDALSKEKYGAASDEGIQELIEYLQYEQERRLNQPTKEETL